MYNYDELIEASRQESVRILETPMRDIAKAWRLRYSPSGRDYSKRLEVEVNGETFQVNVSVWDQSLDIYIMDNEREGLLQVMVTYRGYSKENKYPVDVMSHRRGPWNNSLPAILDFILKSGEEINQVIINNELSRAKNKYEESWGYLDK